jgi:hypothetical protein
MAGAPARDLCLPGSLGGYHHQAAIAHAALGDDVIGEMLHLGSEPVQGGHFHAVVMVEVNVKRCGIMAQTPA